MLLQLTDLQTRVGVVEKAQVDHMNQTTAIKADTEELLSAFQALQGFWKVLAFIGKLAKPITAIAAMFAAFHIFVKK